MLPGGDPLHVIDERFVGVGEDCYILPFLRVKRPRFFELFKFLLGILEVFLRFPSSIMERIS